MVGQFAASLAGHDRQQVYVIIAESEDFVYLCDGRLKKISNPKKKKKKHIQIIHETVGQELLKKLLCGEKVFDEEIKYALKQYQSK